MIKEKATKIINSKYFAIIVVLIINIVFSITCNMLFEPKYEQVDDFIIMNLITKMDGTSTIYGVQMHPIICGIILLLYETGININWYTIFMLLMQFISFTILGTIFVSKNKKLGIPLYIAFVFIIYSKMLSYIQYTTVSMLSITSGIVLLMYSLEEMKNSNRKKLVLSVIMILVGCMIRFSTVIIATPFLGLYLVYIMIKEKNKKVILIALILISSILLINISFTIMYNSNPIYKKFLEFHNARTYLHDYNWMNYKNNEETFKIANWSENDRDIFYAYCFGDEENFNTDNIQIIKQAALMNKKSSTDILYKCIYSLDAFMQEVKNPYYSYAFIIIILITTLSNINIVITAKKDKKDQRIKLIFVNLVLISVIGMHSLFIFLGRPMFRVIISIYMIGSAVAIYMLLDTIKESNKTILLLNGILITYIVIMSLLDFITVVYNAKSYHISDYSVYKEILEYTNSHKENAYLYTLVMHDRYLAYSIYEKLGEDSFSNIRPLGDWDTYTENYYDFKERYGIDNLIESLYKKDNVYLISGDVIWGEKYKEYINIIEKYIKEHYDINIKSNIIKEFDRNIKIYKLQEI